MGCAQSSPPVQKMNLNRSPTAHNFGNFGKDRSLKKENYMWTKRGAEVLVKAPKDINGQQFIVADCVGTDMFLIDHVAMLTIVRIIPAC